MGFDMRNREYVIRGLSTENLFFVPVGFEL